MTHQLLSSELSVLIQESKRRNVDLRSAAEKSLQDLKALPNTSETQLAADLKRRPNFVRPFLLACSTRNPKYAGTGIICLQRLIASNGLAHETLKDVLDLLRECSSLGFDIQIKILQALPSLFQNYAHRLTGPLLANTLEICFQLLGNKTAVVSSTAAATLQQLVVFVLNKVVTEDEHESEGEPLEKVLLENDSMLVRTAAFDAYRLLNDLALLTEGQKPQFLRAAPLSPEFGLELIESLFSNHSENICSHPEQIHVIRMRLMPMIIRILSERVAFSTTLRAMRLLPLIFGNMLSILSAECEMVLGLLNHILDPDAANTWKRVLCMEVFRSIHADPALVRSMYALFDQREGRRNIVGDHLALMVRLAAEKPSVVGLGHQSSMPASTSQMEDAADEQAVLHAEGVAGTIGVAMSAKASNAPGISTQFSTMRVPCIDQLDKSEPPNIPSAYIYTLALTCLNSFSEGLARFLLPFSLPSENRSRRKPRPAKDTENADGVHQSNENSVQTTSQRPDLSRSQSFSVSKIPINPLSLDSHALYSQIQTSAAMVAACWPALLAAYSTFLHAALDSEYYHALIRSFQRFTQVSGVLRLSTPRDAFLTTLGKNAVPPAVVAAYALVNSSGSQTDQLNQVRRGSEINLKLFPNDSTETSRQSLDLNNASLHTRNLLCMRALLYLGIALGPVLKEAWSIILETFQQADAVIDQISLQRRHSTSGQTTPTVTSESAAAGELGNEISAIKVAATRLIESCSELPDEGFLDVLSSFRGLLRDVQLGSRLEDKVSTQEFDKVRHQKRPSMAGNMAWSSSNMRVNLFVVENISKLIDENIDRLLATDLTENGWNQIVDILLDVTSTPQFDSNLRIKAAEAIGSLVKSTSGLNGSTEIIDEVRERGLLALDRQIKTLYCNSEAENKSTKSCELEIHRLALEYLKSALEQYGDSLRQGWNHVFSIIASIFEKSDSSLSGPLTGEVLPFQVGKPKSSKLVRFSFGSLELICSDFLDAIPQECLELLIDTIYYFCNQQQDFNISLTSTTLFWNLSSFLARDADAFELESSISPNSVQVNDTYDLRPPLRERTNSSLWLHLLVWLVRTTADQRPEIRNGALHTIFRIFDVCGDKLNAVNWTTCQRCIILPLITRNEVEYQRKSVQTAEDHKVKASWNETASTSLEAIASLYEHYAFEMVSHSNSNAIWEGLAQRVQTLLDRRSLSVSEAVFTSLSRILAAIRENGTTFPICSRLTWNIWRMNNPAENKEDSLRDRTNNQPALRAYIQCLKEIYMARDERVRLEDVKEILEQLKACAISSSPTAYTGDIDNLSPLQDQLIECLSMIRTSAEDVQSELIKCTSFLATMAYTQSSRGPNIKGPTYVALSKSSMDLLELFLIKSVRDPKIHHSGALTEAIKSLTIPISLKYQWTQEGKEPLTWQKATTTTVSVLNAGIPAVRDMQKNEMSTPFWEEVLRSCDAIISANTSSCNVPSRISPDQDFDIEAYIHIRELLTLALGSSLVTDQLRRTYIESLFTNSIIHEAHPDDLRQSDRDILAGLKSHHIGRVQDLPPNQRLKMSYVLLDELFDLVAVHDGSRERIRLAQAAAPYLILRVGIVLKAYVLDHPLRGRMPQPMSQKREMLYILRKLLELDSEPSAIPDPPGVISKYKKHLHRVFGLVTNALGVATRDAEMQRALRKVIEAVGQNFIV